MPLATGSMLVLDNREVMHGRMAFEGDARTLVTILTED